MDFSSPQLQFLPDGIRSVPYFLCEYGAVWPHTFELVEEEIANLIELGIARTITVSIENKLLTLLVAGSRLQQYTGGAEFQKTPVIQHAVEMASLLDLAAPFHCDGDEVRIDRRRRLIRAGENDDYHMVRMRPPTIRTLARNEDDDSLFLYVPTRHVKSLQRRAERAELYTGNHHNLIVLPFDINSWPPREDNL